MLIFDPATLIPSRADCNRHCAQGELKGWGFVPCVIDGHRKARLLLSLVVISEIPRFESPTERHSHEHGNQSAFN
jgi:hypothetical protein